MSWIQMRKLYPKNMKIFQLIGMFADNFNKRFLIDLCAIVAVFSSIFAHIICASNCCQVGLKFLLTKCRKTGHMHMGFPKLVNFFFQGGKNPIYLIQLHQRRTLEKWRLNYLLNKYEEIDPPYLTNKLLNKDSSKKLSKLINLKGFFWWFFRSDTIQGYTYVQSWISFFVFSSYTTDKIY